MIVPPATPIVVAPVGQNTYTSPNILGESLQVDSQPPASAPTDQIFQQQVVVPAEQVLDPVFAQPTQVPLTSDPVFVPPTQVPLTSDPVFVPPNQFPQASTSGVAPTHFSSTPTDFLEFLMAENSLSLDQVKELRLAQVQLDKTPQMIISERGLFSDSALAEKMAKFHQMPFVVIEETGVSPEALSIVPESIARRYGMLPFAVNKTEKTISVAMRNPLDLSAIDFVEKKTGFKLIPHFSAVNTIDEKISERYAQNISTEVTQVLKETTDSKNETLGDLTMLSKGVIREAPIAKIVETILAFAVQARVSDVHIEPQEDRTRVRYRIDGILAEKLVLPRNVHEALVSRIKILSQLKIDEKRIPQDGRFSFTANGQTVDLRISTLPTVHGEKVVMRLLSKNITVPTLNDLGLRGSALKNMEEAIRVPHGIILMTGPTGSGKTTTIYSVLHLVNTPKVNIVTLEDPVEYEIPGVNQVQTNPQAGLTFASGLRAFLRQDPNIIMVGEIRDSETAELAIQASLTGHLVFSTLHTSSAAGALPRLIDMGAEPFLLASSITLSASQRVVRKLHPDFKETYTPEKEVCDDIKKVLGPLFEAWCAQNKVDPLAPVTLYRGKRDRSEDEPEYQGRVAIFEVLRMNDEIGRLIIERKPAADIENVGIKNGMILMKQDGYLKALDGLTTLEEVIRVADV